MAGSSSRMRAAAHTPSWPGRHAHVEERHRERIVRRERLAHRGDRRFRAVAKYRREHGVAGRQLLDRLIRRGL